ncbi:MAG: SWIM zinc finger family protein [Candidatus Xenobia bacterium]
MYYGGWAPYVSVAERRRQAQREMDKLRKKGHPVAPVIIQGRTIAHTFWGKAWCENLEKYHDFANRLARGRTYVRNGSVVDLQIAPLKIEARVSGSSLYQVSISIGAVSKAQWQSVCRDCTGGIDSLVELLQGRFSKGTMERLCRQREGLFPTPSEIKFSCSCPDYAMMCKHVAAVLYGVGARLDEQPELLFRLRSVDEKDLLTAVDASVPLSKTKPTAGKVLDSDDVSALFGLEMAGPDNVSRGASSGSEAGRKPKSSTLNAKEPPSKAAPAAIKPKAAENGAVKPSKRQPRAAAIKPKLAENGAEQPSKPQPRAAAIKPKAAENGAVKPSKRPPASAGKSRATSGRSSVAPPPERKSAGAAGASTAARKPAKSAAKPVSKPGKAVKLGKSSASSGRKVESPATPGRVRSAASPAKTPRRKT